MGYKNLGTSTFSSALISRARSLENFLKPATLLGEKYVEMPLDALIVCADGDSTISMIGRGVGLILAINRGISTSKIA